MQIRHARRGARIFGLAFAALAIAVPTASAHQRHGHKHHGHHGHHGHKKKDVKVQLLAINDLHGHIAPDTPGTIQTGCCVKNPTTGAWTQTTVPAGGIAYLATHMKALRAKHRASFNVGAGDMIGASPLASALFHDEPTIEGLNTIGFDEVGVGNHEFDEGIDELKRIQYGNRRGGDGCHPVDGCQDGTPFRGPWPPVGALLRAGREETTFRISRHQREMARA